MLKGVNSNDFDSFYDFGENPLSRLKLAPTRLHNIDDEIYGSDEFRMYAYKIKKCTRTRSHDWTECPYAHRSEKATRRDPRKVLYTAIACPAFRNGKCLKGDACEFAHGVFEYWLHPSRYRTRACNAGRFCQRKVCFFAHTPEQLRSQKKYMCPLVYRARGFISNGDQDGILGCGSSGSEDGATSSPVFGSSIRVYGGSYFDGVSDFLNSLRNLKISDDEDHDDDDGNDQGRNFESSGSIDHEFDSDSLPQIDWISELVK